MEKKPRLTPKQVLTRIVSVLVCAVGAAACAFSLTLQAEGIGTVMASLTWFSGLAAVVLAIAGYAVTCDIGAGTSHVKPAVVCIVILAILGGAYAILNLYSITVIQLALIAAGIQLVDLTIYHFVLKAEDPEAL